MFGINRSKRPVELGPFPAERLKRDATIIKSEAAAKHGVHSDTEISHLTPLILAINKHLSAYEELREAEPFKDLAPVPDDLSLRTRDIKGAGYFLDASQIGICEIPETLWVGRTFLHTHAVVIVVEHSDPIDIDNKASEWVQGIEGLISTLRAAEIAINLGGQISSMGFLSCTHWQGAADVDLEKAAVLSGLAIRDKSNIFNPYFDNRFSIAVVTTNYPLQIDLPLSGSIRSGRDLDYFFGLSGGVSGIERWRRKKRSSHLGPYPVEKLKRVEKPTTHIFSDEVPRVPSRANMYMRTALGDIGEKTRMEADRWSQKHPVSQGIVRPSWAIKPLQDGTVAEDNSISNGNPEENTNALKALSYYMGSSISGICEIPDYCWYSHDKRGREIEPYHKYALVVLIDQGYETFLGATGNDWISGSQSMRAYLRGAEIVGVMAEMIRQMGFSARSHSNLDSHVLHVPLVIHAGLGEQSRIGESAINPFLGMRFKTAVLTTDMPLKPDKPIDFGVQTFCSKCQKCARECPCNAIPYGEKVIFNGYETWKPDSERCTIYRATNLKGSACGRCVKVCPLSKDTTLDGPILHQVGSWLGINAMWLKPVLVPIAVWLDDFLGYGNPLDEKKWWLDLEVKGKRSFKYDPENIVVKAKEANRPKIKPGKKKREKDSIAYFPASTLPPPDLMEVSPTDRRQGLKFAENAETVHEALARRAAGGKPPKEYKPNYKSSRRI